MELPTHRADLREQEVEVIYTYARGCIPLVMDTAASRIIYLSTSHSLSTSNDATRGPVLVDGRHTLLERGLKAQKRAIYQNPGQP